MFIVTDYLRNWFRTSRDVILKPRQFFAEMPASGGLKEPLGFAVVAIFIASVLSTLATLFIFFPEGTVSWLVSPSISDSTLVGILLLIIFFLYSFVTGLISVPVNSAIDHVLLKLCGAHGDFQATFRVFCYYMAVSMVVSPAAFILIPPFLAAYKARLEGVELALLLLMLIPAVYSFYVLLVGFSLVHGISIKQVVLAVVGIPAGLVIAFMILVVGLVFISGTGSTAPIPYSANQTGIYIRPDAAVVNSSITAPYGTAPDVDGFYTSGDKWDEARPVNFTSQGVNYTVAAKHDGKMLYFLIMWKGGPEWKNSVSLYFEQDGDSHDHDIKTGRNDEKYNGATEYGPSNFADAHYEGGVAETEDGMVRGNYRDGLWVQEWVVPLRSGDPADIYVDQFPTTLGFAIVSWNREGSNWPSENVLASQPVTWGDLYVLDGGNAAYAPPPSVLVAKTGTAPVIDGSFTPADKWDEGQGMNIISIGADYYTLAAKHDSENLYVLIKWPGEPKYNSAFIFFEQDGTTHDHEARTGRSDIKYNGATVYEPSNFADYHYEGVITETMDRKQDGRARSNYSNGSWVYEWEVPLRSGDKDDLYVDRFPTTLGFMVEFGNGKKDVYWPHNASRYSGPVSWGDLVLE